MKVEKVMINRVGYYHFRHCDILWDLCDRCCFMKKLKNGATRCLLPFKCEPKGYYIYYNEKLNILGGINVNVDCPPPPETGEAGQEPESKEAGETKSADLIVADKEGKDSVFTETLKAYEIKREGSIGKRSYYAFPNGVEAEDICRYLSFNLGNVVKYSCRAGRKDAKKKIEDLRKAKDYLENEIKRLEEGDD